MFSIFKKYPQILAELSEKDDGNMRLAEIDKGKETYINRKKFFSKIGADSASVVSGKLIHSSNVYLANEKDKGKIIPKTDALVTNTCSVFLSVTVADCLPIYFFDPKKNAIGLAHAGWRGLKAGIISSVIFEFEKKFGSNPSDILVGIGPGISVRYYEVGDEVIAKFRDYPKALEEKNGKKYLNLKNIAKAQLLGSGVLSENIEIHLDCTYSKARKYFSYRRDKPEKIEAMLAIIGIKS